MKLFLAALSIVPFVACQNFDKNYVGVAFGPYTKYKENGAIPLFNSYSTDEIKRMLAVVSTKFSHIATYGMGVASYNVEKSWDQADSSALVARAASYLNKEKERAIVEVAIGIYQNEDRKIQDTEVNHAFDAADDANERYKGTVWGVIFTNEYITDNRTGQKVLGMIRYDKNRAHTKGLSVGTRINVCDQILYSRSQLFKVLTDIAREADFIMCNVYPASDVVNSGSQYAIDAVGNFCLKVQRAFKNINNNLQVMIGETGWPSDGESYNKSPNSVQNMKNFWSDMGQWASRNAVRTYMFEAIDEPYKGGPTGEAHFGWWYRKDNKGQAYVEKVTNQRML